MLQPESCSGRGASTCSGTGAMPAAASSRPTSLAHGIRLGKRDLIGPCSRSVSLQSGPYGNARRPLRPGSSGGLTGVSCQAAAQQQQQAQRNSSRAQQVTKFGLLQGFREKYELGPKLGAGGFGVVHVAQDRETGESYAVKTIPKRLGPDGALQRDFAARVRNEVDVYSRLGTSLNIAFMYAAYEDDSCVYLVMELCRGGQLWDRILAGAYSERDAAVIVREVVRIVAQCHAAGVVMRDVKPDNFLFLTSDPSSPLKAIDFGSAIFLPPGQHLNERAGTIIYLAPEVARQKYDSKVDVWGVGLVAYQLLTGRLPFSGEDGEAVSHRYMTTRSIPSTKDVFRAILYAPLDFESPPWPDLSPAACDFVQLLLQRDPEQRPTAEQALRHPWLAAAASGGGGEEGNGSPNGGRPLSDTVVQRLQRFGTYGTFKQGALRLLGRQIASSGDTSFVADLAALWGVMAVESPDPSGMRVQYAQVLKALQDPRFDLTTGEMGQLTEQLGVDARGWIRYDSWLAALVDWRQVEQSLDWDSMTAALFRALDHDGDEALDRADLETLLCGAPGACEFPDEVDAALREAQAAAAAAAAAAPPQPGSSPAAATSGRAGGGGGGAAGGSSGVGGAARIGLPEFRAMLHSGMSDDLSLYETRLAEDHEHESPPPFPSSAAASAAPPPCASPPVVAAASGAAPPSATAVAVAAAAAPSASPPSAPVPAAAASAPVPAGPPASAVAPAQQEQHQDRGGV